MTSLRSDRPFHPALLAAYPVLALFAHNQHELFLAELREPLGWALAGALGAWALLVLLLRDVRAAAVASSALAALFFSYGHVLQWVARLRIRHRWIEDAWIDALWVALAVLAVALATRARARRPGLARGLNVVAAFLVLLPAAQIAAYSVLDRDAGDLAAADVAAVALDAPPNVYYIVLDGYAREDVLRDVYGFDNGPFVAALRARGFHVADEARANYAMTFLSLPSALNLRYLDEDAPDPNSKDRERLYRLVRTSELATFFRESGYRYVHFNSGWGPTAYEVDADWTVECGRLTEFQRALVTTTPLLLAPDLVASQDRDRTLCQLDLLAEMPSTPGPFFVFAHVLAPHPPYVFRADGSPVDASDPVADGEVEDAADLPRKRALFVEQTRYVNARVLALVDEILARETHPPVIVLQSDHGPDSLEVALADWEDPSPEFLRERMANLNAVLLPPGADTADLDAHLTPVNTFRVVLDAVYGTSYGRLPDRSLFSTYERPYEWTDVTDIVADREP